MVDFTRRHFIFGVAASAVILPAAKHFIMPKFDLYSQDEIARFRAAARVALGNWLDGEGVIKPDPNGNYLLVANPGTLARLHRLPAFMS